MKLERPPIPRTLEEIEESDWWNVANREYTCAVCGYKTIEHSTGSICEICFWEADDREHWEPVWQYTVCGPNRVSLYQAQANFVEFGASEERCMEWVRLPLDVDIKDPEWKFCPKKTEEEIAALIKDLSKKEAEICLTL